MKKTTALILIVLAFALFYTFTSPQYRDAQALNELAGEYRNVINNVEMIADARDSLLLGYESIPLSEKERLAKVLPPNADVVGLARELDTIASRHGFTVTSVGIETGNRNSSNIVLPEYEQPYEKTAVTFSFITNYTNFSNFLADLEKSLRLMDVKAVSFQVGESALYEHRVTVETYWLK